MLRIFSNQIKTNFYLHIDFISRHLIYSNKYNPNMCVNGKGETYEEENRTRIVYGSVVDYVDVYSCGV